MFGKATPGSEIVVKLADQIKKMKTTKDTWRVDLDPMPAGGPFQLMISGDQSEWIYQDVMLGEVWLASGQSNMAMNLKHTTGFEVHLPEKNFLSYVM